MKLKIIYLDDEPALCEMFADNFASSFVTILTFTDPEAAIKAINQSKPDLVFLDYRLPGTTGQDVATRLNPDLPKVLITGDLRVNDMNCFIKIFHKPFDFEEMEALIHSFLDRKKVA
ncbi:MAG: response regulator [Proteobacteria bacterium]|nr:response regulator [Pseudomonadota bacterium]